MILFIHNVYHFQKIMENNNLIYAKEKQLYQLKQLKSASALIHWTRSQGTGFPFWICQKFFQNEHIRGSHSMV